MLNGRPWQAYLPRLSGRSILLLLSSMVALHLVVMYFYIQDNRYAWGTANREHMIQKIINTIQLVNATPAENRMSAINALADPLLSVSLTPQPVWPLRFHQISFWEIYNALRTHADSPFSVSIRLEENIWLNCQVNPKNHVLISQLLLITLEIIMAAALLISAWSIHRFTRPLTKFKEGAERLGVDLNTKPLHIEYGPPIVKDTANTINKMQERIQHLLQSRTNMLAAISHDLRTPITRMKLRLQLDANAMDTAIQQKNIKDLEEMETMITQTLSFAREGRHKEEKVRLDLASLLDTLTEECADLAEPVTLSMTPRSLPVYGRPIALKRALTNLINNGLHYGGKVHIIVKLKSKKVQILIDDEGPGIPEQDRNQVFEPFYRREPSRSKNTGGVGLGLAVTRDIIHAHDGTIQLQNRPSICPVHGH